MTDSPQINIYFIQINIQTIQLNLYLGQRNLYLIRVDVPLILTYVDLLKPVEQINVLGVNRKKKYSSLQLSRSRRVFSRSRLDFRQRSRRILLEHKEKYIELSGLKMLLFQPANFSKGHNTLL